MFAQSHSSSKESSSGGSCLALLVPSFTRVCFGMCRTPTRPPWRSGRTLWPRVGQSCCSQQLSRAEPWRRRAGGRLAAVPGLRRRGTAWFVTTRHKSSAAAGDLPRARQLLLPDPHLPWALCLPRPSKGRISSAVPGFDGAG